MKSNWDNIKQISEGFGEGLDVGASWERFEEIRNKRKKRIFVWWLSGFMAFLLFTTLFFLSSETGSNSVERSKEILTENDNLYDVKVSDKIISHKDLKSSNQIADNVIAEIENEALKSIKSKSIFKEGNPNDSSIKVSKNKKGTHQLINNKKRKIVIEENKNNLQVKDDGLTNTSESFILNDISNSKKRGKIMNSFVNNSKQIELIRFEFIPKLYSVNYIETEVPSLRLILAKSKFRASNNDNYLSFKTAYGIVDRRLNYPDISYENRRLNKENLKEYISMDITGSKFISDKFSISLGLGLQQIRSSIFEVSQIIENNVTFNDVILESLYSEGNTTEVRGSVIGSRTFITEHLRFQNYIDISLAMSIAYHIDLSDKLFMYASTGIATSLVNLNNGMTFYNEISSGQYINLDDLGYKKSVVFKSISELNIGFSINEEMSIHLGVGYNRDLSNRLKIPGQSDRFRSLFLSTGFSFKL